MYRHGLFLPRVGAVGAGEQGVGPPQENGPLDSRRRPGRRRRDSCGCCQDTRTSESHTYTSQMSVMLSLLTWHCGLYSIPIPQRPLFAPENDSAHNHWSYKDVALMAKCADTAPLFLDADASKCISRSHSLVYVCMCVHSHHRAWWTNRRTDESQSQERPLAIYIHLVS